MATSKAFLSSRRATSQAATAELRKHATRFLRRIANDLRLSPDDCEIVVHTPASSRQRIVLLTGSFLLEIRDTEPGSPVAIAYRTRKGWADLSGGGDNAVPVDQIDSPEGYAALLQCLKLSKGLQIFR
jgi:hypothetical protein